MILRGGDLGTQCKMLLHLLHLFRETMVMVFDSVLLCFLQVELNLGPLRFLISKWETFLHLEIQATLFNKGKKCQHWQ